MNINSKNKNIISYENFRNWSIYESNLTNYPTVGKYLKHTFKYWVENHDQPLAIPWLRELLNNRLTFLEVKLLNLYQKAPEIINSMIHELAQEKSKSASQILIKIFSLNGELLSLNYLAGFYDKIEKINKYGDFKCNNDIIVSVKTKSEMNFNLDIIINYFEGLTYITDYEELNDFQIRFEKSDGLDYVFLKSILKFISHKLLESIKNLHNPLTDFDLNPKEFSFIDIRIKVDKYLSKNRMKIDFEFVYIENKKFKLTLTRIGKNPLRNKIRLLDIYRPDEEEYQLSAIKNSLNTFINDFDIKSIKYNKRKFRGIINIPVPCRFQKAFITSIQSVESELESLFKDRKYKIVFHFYPLFLDEMKAEHKYEIN